MPWSRRWESPARDRYQIVHQHPAHELIVQDTGLGIQRSNKVVLITITSVHRADELKQALYKALSEEIERRCGVSPNDITANLSPSQIQNPTGAHRLWRSPVHLKEKTVTRGRADLESA